MHHAERAFAHVQQHRLGRQTRVREDVRHEPGIDTGRVEHAGHAGGFVTGGLLGLMVKDYTTSRSAARWRYPAYIAGAVLALLGCGLGNLLAVCGLIASQEGMGFFEVVGQLNLDIIRELIVVTFCPMDLLFYGIAVYEGYKLSFRQVSEQDIVARITGQGAIDQP